MDGDATYCSVKTAAPALQIVAFTSGPISVPLAGLRGPTIPASAEAGGHVTPVSGRGVTPLSGAAPSAPGGAPSLESGDEPAVPPLHAAASVMARVVVTAAPRAVCGPRRSMMESGCTLQTAFATPLTGRRRHSIRTMLAPGGPLVSLRIAVVPTSHPEAEKMLAEYYAEIRKRFGFGVKGQADAADMDPPGGRFLIAYEDDRPVASGGIRTWEPGVCEIKRMYVVPDARRRGYGRQLLAAVERVAAEAGFRRIVL